MKYATQKINKTAFSTWGEKFRLILGISMMFIGLYFGLFTIGIGESLGFMSVMASPFVMITDL